MCVCRCVALPHSDVLRNILIFYWNSIVNHWKKKILTVKDLLNYFKKCKQDWCEQYYVCDNFRKICSKNLYFNSEFSQLSIENKKLEKKLRFLSNFGVFFKVFNWRISTASTELPKMWNSLDFSVEVLYIHNSEKLLNSPKIEYVFDGPFFGLVYSWKHALTSVLIKWINVYWYMKKIRAIKFNNISVCAFWKIYSPPSSQ